MTTATATRKTLQAAAREIREHHELLRDVDSDPDTGELPPELVERLLDLERLALRLEHMRVPEPAPADPDTLPF